MRVIVVGAGTVGSNIASHLARDRHEVIVLDRNPARISEVEDHLDVQTIAGDAVDPHVLRTSMAGQPTELLLALTEADNTNLIIAYAAKKLGIARVVARVRSRYYLETGTVNFRDPLGIDLLLSPEILSAQELATFVENPAALAFVALAQGRVQLRTVLASPFSEHNLKSMKEIVLPPGVLVAAVRRGKEIFIPRGEDTIEAGDHVTLIGLPTSIDQAHPQFDTEQDTQTARKLHVAVAGAGETGLYLAELLEARNHDVTLIERNRQRCEIASERLHSTVVLHGDCTNIQFLREERIDRMDYFIAVTGDDESNVMAALLARELKVDKTACLIDRPDYVRIAEKVGIDVAISPRIVAANRIMTLVKKGRIRSVTLLEEGAVEVTEYQALSRSPIVGRTLKEVELPQGTLIGGIVRGPNVVIPRGPDMIRPGDIVITISAARSSDELSRLFLYEAES